MLLSHGLGPISGYIDRWNAKTVKWNSALQQDGDKSFTGSSTRGCAWLPANRLSDRPKRNMTAIDFSSFVDQLATASGDTILPFFRTALAIENKKVGGFDPVTAADRAAEQAMRVL